MANTKHGGPRIRPKIIDQLHDEWCKENGYKRSSVQASEQASEQADKREGGPTSCQADKLNAVNSSRFVESAQAQLGRKPKKIR